MTAYNMLEAKNQLSKLVEAVESGSVEEVIIARNGKPAVRVVTIAVKSPRIRLGLAKNRYRFDAEIDADDDIVAIMFGQRYSDIVLRA